jgi:hypothetical protein
MKKKILFIILLLTILFISCNLLEKVLLNKPTFNQKILLKLRSASLVNQDEILKTRQLNNSKDDPKKWLTDNPYNPFKPLSELECDASIECSYARDVQQLTPPRFPAQDSAYKWWVNRETTQLKVDVCGVKFLNTEKTQYRLKSFSSLSSLQNASGYYLTHFQACGTCSSLQDLAVYGELDLTKMAKTCSKKLTLEGKKKCMQQIGFTESCSETWAYNGANTAKFCVKTCIKTYGFFEIIFGFESVPPTDNSNRLNPCILCDERISGPGFQYTAGRTRRSSGIISEIDRPNKEIYSVSHDYFQ